MATINTQNNKQVWSSSVTREKGFNTAMAAALPTSFLGDVTDWVRDNLNPDEVFPSGQLKKFVSDIFSPDEVYPQAELEKWAEQNGYQKRSALSQLNG